jgi:hypothetical protein
MSMSREGSLRLYYLAEDWRKVLSPGEVCPRSYERHDFQCAINTLASAFLDTSAFKFEGGHAQLEKSTQLKKVALLLF